MNVKAKALAAFCAKKHGASLDVLLACLETPVPYQVFMGAQAAKQGESARANPFKGFGGANWWTGWMLEHTGRFPWDRPVESAGIQRA